MDKISKLCFSQWLRMQHHIDLTLSTPFRFYSHHIASTSGPDQLLGRDKSLGIPWYQIKYLWSGLTAKQDQAATI